MKLQTENFKKIIHNVIEYEIDGNNSLHFRRFTKSQMDAYKAEANEWIMKANASALVTFDFVSDSEYIALKFDLYPATAQMWASFDLYVDGILCEHKKFNDINVKLVSFELPEGEHRITIYFPWTVQTVVNEVHLSDGASIKEVSKSRKAIIFGDSITQGYVTEFTSLTYTSQVAMDADIELVNQGIGGYYFGINSIDESLISYNPDFLMIAYGTNDYTRYETRDMFEMNVSKYIEKLTSLFPNIKILAILPIYRNDHNHLTRERYRDYTLEDARDILIRIYEKYNNITILKETEIPIIPEAFFSDYLHPNELGFTFMAKSVVKEILNMPNK